LRNDTSLLELPREPFNILITETPHYRYGFVAHSAGAGLTLIDLDGLGGSGGRPAITDIVDLFLPTSGSGIRAGGFGLAARPCSVEDGNAPSITQGCTRPLVYASLRFQLSMISFTASGLDDTELPANAADRDSCYGDIDGDGVDEFVGPFCASPDEVGQACAVICEPTVQAARRLDRVGGIDPFSPIQSAALGDVVFGDARGDALYVIETNPGALIKMNTALDFDAEPFDISSAPPIELCAEPNRMTIWNDMAFVTCFRAAYIFVIDLRSFQVIDTIITGTGPHDLVVDSGRLVLYAANTLEGSVSVIDIDPTHATRFAEIARIGLQEPFSQ
jgi:hypothetical protein